ncbi:MAG: aminotransferase class V-fold PLP-dependent enzyme [Deltaproteobacteria bacterium]|nr:aminotransferase class V-fold PLP-dependent enzyme [Deltaproteobacteria bacterium]
MKPVAPSPGAALANGAARNVDPRSADDLRRHNHAAHWSFDPDVLFLNHGSFGACPRPILAAQHRLRESLEAQPVEFLARQLPDRLVAARAALADFVGTSPDGLAFVSNATMGVNTVLRSLSFQPGDQILVTDHGYAACTNAARFVADRSGAELVTVKIPTPLSSPDEVVAAILQAATDRTRLALIDHITSPTGLVFPIAAIVRALDARGIDTLVDGAHAPGMIDLNIDDIGAAYYTGNGHKWMCAPKGAAFLSVREDRRSRVRPLVISHGASLPLTDASSPSSSPSMSASTLRYRLEFDWMGTMDPTPWLVLPDAIQFLNRLTEGGSDALFARLRATALDWRRRLLAYFGLEAGLGPEEMVGALVSIPLPSRADVERPDPRHGHPLQRWLWDERRIELPILAWPAPPATRLRTATHLYVPSDALDRLIEALDDARDLGLL